jgi:hypothetical protein
MKIIALSVALTAMTTVAALGGDVPFASPAPPSPGRPNGSDLISLADLMVVMQLRHIKLWYAGKSEDWNLVSYEIDRIRETLTRAAFLYTNIPVEYIEAVGGPLAGMREAVATKNSGRFLQSYSDLTTACNSCHSAAQVGFLQIRTPISSPFSDEVYEK